MKKIDNLVSLTSTVFSLPNINQNNRQLPYVEARAIVYTILRNIEGMTFTSIGNYFNKSHATILHAYNEFPYMIKYNPLLTKKYHQILSYWGEKLPKNSGNLLNFYQNKVKNLEEQNKFLNLSYQELKTKVKNMAWGREDCKYTSEDAEKIEHFKTWSDRKKIDTLLHIDCILYCNLGVDSSLKDRSEVKQKSKIIYRTIKRIDAAIGTLLLTSMD